MCVCQAYAILISCFCVLLAFIVEKVVKPSGRSHLIIVCFPFLYNVININQSNGFFVIFVIVSDLYCSVFITLG